MKKNKLTISIISITIILTILLLDQIVKIWIKTHFAIGDEIKITNFFYLHFIENEGMAFGMSFFDKKYLTLFRIVASIGIAYYIYKSIKNNSEQLFIISLSLIFAGAIGNIIDSLFYGQIFTESTLFSNATWTPWGQGYAPIFYGKVVDMLYFPLISGTYWSWIPIVGGTSFTFFAPVFNIADASITIGVILILVYEIFFSPSSKKIQ
ncbi:MAG TPA: lipoprotein signal peptidase [Paludibacteraceae bacterium]|nr:lipoprotein signal peptidase [Paludibacteraceae bacterium]HOU26484.1 lipoprotein signal peptidase [Paludibacteraceae bacterium]HPL94299.1 lipoprotein signal peptidase [Paludibacteraceae bacterium]